jgi:iron complex transport system substrate-binding protein
VRIPAEKVVCLSTTHVGFIERLGRVTSIAGVSGKDLVVSKDLRALIDKGSVYESAMMRI